MQVRFLHATDYKPTVTDSHRCYGQLRQRASVVVKETVEADGRISLKDECGPMVTYFPKGATPDLEESVARAFIESGAAEAFDGPVVEVCDGGEMLKELLAEAVAKPEDK